MADLDGKDREQLHLLKAEGYVVYNKRWLMLGIFGTFAMSNYFLWAQYAAISDSVAEYYDVSLDTVDWLSIVNLITYVAAILPVMWLTERCNLKFVLVLGAFLQCIGAWIRYAGTVKYSIAVNFIGQILCALGQPCCFGMSSQMAGTWFGISEVSLANGIGFAAVEIGVGFSIVISPLVVQNGPELDSQMKSLFLYTAIVITLILPLTILVFEASPPLPPSRPKMNMAAAGKQVQYYLSLKVLFQNRNFLVILAANSFNLGFLSLIAFKLNETVLLAFSEDESSTEIVQYVGMVKIISCIFGPIAVGIWLDRSRSFRGTTIVTAIMATIAIACFTLSLYFTEGFLVILSMALYWFFAACMIIVVFEYAVELTYPEPEIMSSGLLNATGYTVACFMMLLYDVFLESTNVYITITIFCCTLFIAFILTLFIDPTYRRQDADIDNFDDSIVSESDTEITNK
ncbi:choline/ethanolamine transporter FLVCR2-like [Antedon mediterranea]|uniref:choline/ethanolamine transporter FLVCR2-like n=1 Tax=Antedon mediterranea TaxID=105859 RepID=UPI003AF48B3B